MGDAHPIPSFPPVQCHRRHGLEQVKNPKMRMDARFRGVEWWWWWCVAFELVMWWWMSWQSDGSP